MNNNSEMIKVLEIPLEEDSVSVYEKENTYVIESVDEGKKEQSEYRYTELYPKGYEWSESEVWQHGMREMDGFVKAINETS